MNGQTSNPVLNRNSRDLVIERGRHIAPIAKAYISKNSFTFGIENVWDRTKVVEAVSIAYAEGRRMGLSEKGSEL